MLYRPQYIRLLLTCVSRIHNRLIFTHIFNFITFDSRHKCYMIYRLRVPKKPLGQIVTCFPPRPWHLAHYFPNHFQWAFFVEENYYVCLSHRRFKLNLYYRAYINLCKYVFHKFYCAIQFSLAWWRKAHRSTISTTIYRVIRSNVRFRFGIYFYIIEVKFIK